MSKELDNSLSRAEEQAMEWVVRLSSGAMSQRNQQALEKWLSEDPNHQAILDTILGTWDLMGAAEVIQKKERQKKPNFRYGWSRSGFGYEIAAAIALLFISVPLIYSSLQRGEPVVAIDDAQVKIFQSEIGEIKTALLDDGSQVELNTGTKLIASFSSEKRNIDLEEGEAFFSVSSDPERPFEIQAGEILATVTGTKFFIRHEAVYTEISVTEGEVVVSYSGTNSERPRYSLSHNQKIRWTKNTGFEPITIVDLEAVNAWRNGLFIFQEKELSEILDEINRYHQISYYIDDPILAGTQLSGTFEIKNASQIIQVIKEQYQLEEEPMGPGRFLLTRDPGKN